MIAQIVTYIMAIVLWFITEHDSFWYDFKELLWAICPIINFTYVWDWWIEVFITVVGFAFTVIDYYILTT